MRRLDIRREEGVAMAEFALIVPVFLLLFVGITAFGQGFYYWIKANHAANETARWAAVDHNPYGVSLPQHVCDEIGHKTNVTIAFEDDDPNDGVQDPPAIGKYVTVSVAKPLTFKIHLPLIPALNSGFTIRGTSTQRIESMGSLTGPTAYSPSNTTCP